MKLAQPLQLFATRTGTYNDPHVSRQRGFQQMHVRPSGQLCTVSDGSGTVSNGNITNIAVSCVASTAASFTTPGPYTWTVSAGVTSIRMVVTGGDGGGSSNVNSGTSSR